MPKKEEHTVAIIIPLYKREPDISEILSLKQCLNVLGQHPIIFISPEQLDTTVYEHYCADYIPFLKEQFDNGYFKDIAGYNQLMLSTQFYKRFLKYKYILIYQLDAFVFKNELLYWCQKGYDYIGAPHVAHQNRPGEMQFLKNYSRLLYAINKLFKTGFKVKNVGNGGFSLRKTRNCYLLLKYMPSKIRAWGTLNEDGFFKYWGNLLFPFFNLPPDNVASRFAIETDPEATLAQFNGHLPFGCHAFEKYAPEFWQKYIPGLQEK